MGIILKFLFLLMTFFVIAPYGVSFIISNEYHHMIQNIQRANPQVIIKGTFDKGYLKSKAVTVIQTKNYSGAANFSINLIHDIENGPVIFDLRMVPKEFKMAKVHTHFDSNIDMMIKALTQNNNYKYSIESSFDFLGNGITELNFPSIEIALKNINLISNGFNYSLNHNRNWDHLKSKFVQPSIVMLEEKNSMEINGIKGNIEQTLGKQGLWTGFADLEVGSIILNENAKSVFSLYELVLSSALKFSGENLEYMLHLAIDKLHIPRGPYGPGKFNLYLRNLDLTGLKVATGSVNDMKKNGNIFDLNQDRAQEIYGYFLKNQPGISIEDTTFKMPEGDLTLQLKAFIGGSDAANINDIETVMNSLYAKGRLQLPKQVVFDIIAANAKKALEQEREKYQLYHEGEAMPEPVEMSEEAEKIEIEKRVEEEINRFLKDKVFVSEDQYYIVDFMIEKGKMIINGKESPLPWS